MAKPKGHGKIARFEAWYRNAARPNLGQLDAWQYAEVKRLAKKAFLVGYAFAAARLEDTPTNKELEEDEDLLVKFKQKFMKKYGGS